VCGTNGSAAPRTDGTKALLKKKKPVPSTGRHSEALKERKKGLTPSGARIFEKRLLNWQYEQDNPVGGNTSQAKHQVLQKNAKPTQTTGGSKDWFGVESPKKKTQTIRSSCNSKKDLG
jgi:hypothetical protein